MTHNLASAEDPKWFKRGATLDCVRVPIKVLHFPRWFYQIHQSINNRASPCVGIAKLFRIARQSDLIGVTTPYVNV